MNKADPVTFTVEGRGPFPLDMLRYDECYPTSGDDAASIGLCRSCNPAIPGTLPIRRVRMASRRDPFNTPTVARWDSFGWKVVEVDNSYVTLPKGTS